MQSINKELEQLNTKILAISADSPEKLTEKALAFEFALLGDPELKVIDQFGLRHEGGNPKGTDIARPALILLDKDGAVLKTLLTDDWRIRPTAEEILALVKAVVAAQ